MLAGGEPVVHGTACDIARGRLGFPLLRGCHGVSPGAMHAHAFPTPDMLPFLHPSFVKQMRCVLDGKFLALLCDRVVSSSTGGSVQHTKAGAKTALAGIVDFGSLLNALHSRWPDAGQHILNRVVFSSRLVHDLWVLLQKSGHVVALCGRAPLEPASILPLELFAKCYSHWLNVADDQEFYEQQTPFSLDAVIVMVDQLRQVLFRLYWTELSEEPLNDDNLRMRGVLTATFQQLRHRQARRKFCDAELWLMKRLPPDLQIVMTRDSSVDGTSSVAARMARILKDIPFVLSFEQRVDLFYRCIEVDKGRAAEGGIPFDAGRGTPVRIRRSQVLQDGFSELNQLGKVLKGRIQVTFITDQGVPEAGIDGGGLFKEFLTELTVAAYNPLYGLFKETADHALYPNPHSDSITPDHLRYMEFLGRILGKAMYDGILVETTFANFFLHKLLRRHNHLDDLASLDRELYHNLLKVKRFDGDVSQMSLTFSVSERGAFDQTRTVDLVADGRHVEVTNENRLRFIHTMANYKLNKQIRSQCSAFLRGLTSIMDRSLIKMFSADELQQLISGSRVVDMADLKANTNYGGGYSQNHELIRWFWSIVEDDMSADEHAQLLKFATSCSRAPLLGFQALDPKFCVHRAGGDSDNLVTAATCMNFLKIPRYSSRAKLKAKLMQAITCGDGFHLT